MKPLHKNTIGIYSSRYFLFLGSNSFIYFLIWLFNLRSSSFIVPVPFNLNVLAFGLEVPFGRPKVAPLATVKWDPLGAWSAPDMLETYGLDEVLRPKVDAVGAAFGLCFDLCLACFGGT